MKKHSIKTVDALFVQAGIAAALSFSHLHDLAAAAGQGTWQAWAYPVSVDLLLFAAWRRIRAGRGGAQVWCWFIVALVASLTANLATAGLMAEMPPTLRLIIAGWPAVAFLGGTLLVHGKRPTEAVDTPAEPVDVPLPPVETPLYPPASWVDADALESLREPEPVQQTPPAQTDMTDEEIIENGWRYGIDYKEVAKQVGKHPSTIYRRYKRLESAAVPA